MSLLPSSGSEIEATQEGNVVVLDFADDEADRVFEVLSSSTPRVMLSALYDEPATASELATRVGTTVQNAMYHLDRLESAELVRIAGTRYSAKGKEMNVYAPGENPLVMFVGSDERKTGIFDTLKRLIGSITVVWIASLFAYTISTGGLPFVRMLGDSGGSSSDSLLLVGFVGGLLALLLRYGWRVTAERSDVTRSEAVGMDQTRRAACVPSFERAPRSIALTLFALSGGFWSLQGLRLEWLPRVPFFPTLAVTVVVCVVVAVVLSARRHRLPACRLVSFAPFAGISCYPLATMVSLWSNFGEAIVFATVYLLAAALGGVVVGTVGHVVGNASRRLVVRQESSDTSSTDPP